jgi:hypothetical protein
MEQVICPGCSNAMQGGDQYCGNCGLAAQAATQYRAPWPGTTNGDTPASAGVQDTPFSPGEFFSHAQRREPESMSNATRYLCAAAYLDRPFANRVIGELIASHRSVVPSVGFDLGPIIRHCFNARRITLIRDVLLTLSLIVALIAEPTAVIIFVLLALVLGVLIPNARWTEKRVGGRLMLGLAIAAVIAVISLVYIFHAVSASFSAFSSGGVAASGSSNGPGIFATFVILLAVAGTTQFAYVYAKFRTLSEKLRPDASQIQPQPERADRRIAAVEAAQWGNVTLYGGEDPFIGTGHYGRKDWSIAIGLDRARPPGQLASASSSTRGYAPIDPVELHRVIRERLLKLNDPSLPPNERVSALTVEDHVVGSGRLRSGSPLVDMTTKTPYSQANPEAIDALIRHPQAGLRYYQRVSVSDEGPPVMVGDQQIIESIDQGITVSAFVYVAVEGRMFYIEFIRTALPPIRRYYQEIDNMPVVSSGKFFMKVLTETVKSLFGTIALAPIGIFSTARAAWNEQGIEDEATSSDNYVFGDFGAHVSVRELGATTLLGTYIRILDVEKYTSIIERLLLDAVLDFLAKKGVDTSAFAGRASAIINGDVISVRTVSGGQNVLGGHAHNVKQTSGHGSS